MERTAPNESWKPMSNSWRASQRRMMMAESPSALYPFDRTCSTPARRYIIAMTVARTTDGWLPVIAI